MSKVVKGFLTRDDYINNTSGIIATRYELSDIAHTFSQVKQQYYSTDTPVCSLYVFKSSTLVNLTQSEANTIIRVITTLDNLLQGTVNGSKQQVITTFINDYNTVNPTTYLESLDYTVLPNSQLPAYLTFIVAGITCQIWLSDTSFKTFYPDYDINIVLPFENFASVVNTPANMIAALDTFDLLAFNDRVEANKANLPTTHTRMLNIPYRIPNTDTYKNCYFAFNIYGQQGNFDYILKLRLYDYLISLGVPTETVEVIFPSVLNINEFFVVPRYGRVAIPSQVGQAGICSQITSAFAEVFDMTKFVKVHTDINFFKANTYAVPFDYNNILLHIVNGLHSQSAVQDFKTYYSDLITVTSSHMDFSRMSEKTQRLITLLENMLYLADSDDESELFYKIMNNAESKNFTMITRSNVTYVSYFYLQHQFYMLPKYEYVRLNA